MKIGSTWEQLERLTQVRMPGELLWVAYALVGAKGNDDDDDDDDDDGDVDDDDDNLRGWPRIRMPGELM